ncbi:MAG: TetR/AcrR family transcriptional regulator, partial [Lachnospiraceae bacterium]|nr:TetR/AcrR family transcriptional regulator [Lachnospiraceae bacterium]
AKKEPWVFNMFVLMGQARRAGMPEEVRKIASGASAVEMTAEIIKNGQEKGVFKDGDPKLMAICFWASVQGIMEEMSLNENMKAPDPEWITAMIKK